VSYKRGDLKLTDCDDDTFEHDHWNDPCVYVRDSKKDIPRGLAPVGTAFLDHSCSEWVIGGIEEMEALRDDLQQAIQNVKDFERR